MGKNIPGVKIALVVWTYRLQNVPVTEIRLHLLADVASMMAAKLLDMLPVTTSQQADIMSP